MQEFHRLIESSLFENRDREDPHPHAASLYITTGKLKYLRIEITSEGEDYGRSGTCEVDLHRAHTVYGFLTGEIGISEDNPHLGRSSLCIDSYNELSAHVEDAWSGKRNNYLHITRQLDGYTVFIINVYDDRGSYHRQRAVLNAEETTAVVRAFSEAMGKIQAEPEGSRCNGCCHFQRICFIELLDVRCGNLQAQSFPERSIPGKGGRVMEAIKFRREVKYNIDLEFEAVIGPEYDEDGVYVYMADVQYSQHENVDEILSREQVEELVNFLENTWAEHWKVTHGKRKLN